MIKLNLDRFKRTVTLVWVLAIAFFAFQCGPEGPKLALNKGDHIILVGNNLGSRMMNYGYFETEMHVRYPDSLLYIRNMSDAGDTPGFRPHSGRVSPWAFPGAEEFQDELATPSGSEGHLESPDEWIKRHEADIIVGFFGYNESFQGQEGLDRYKQELEAFINHTKNTIYNGEAAPQLALVSPIAFENLSADYDLPNGEAENRNLKLYTEAMQEVAAANQVLFVNAFDPSASWYADSEEYLTIDGFQLTEDGYKKFSKFLTDKLFGSDKPVAEDRREAIRGAVLEKNWMWHNDYKIPNGVHVFGRRYNPFGPDNYPYELKKIRQMTDNRDQAIWKVSQGESFDLAAADANTIELPAVETNYNPEKNGDLEYLYGEDALEKFEVAEGYKVELFASESEFPDLANPVQMTFDTKGRLWVAVMPSYPHYKPGDPKPNDKILILEDTNNDGKADKQIVFADSLHLPIGMEIAEEGVYLSQGTNLIILRDKDGDDYAEEREILLSGFDDHDTHHNISAFVADPSGAIYMGEGVFLHTNVETPYGPVRATNGGFYRYNPARRRLERTAQLPIPNPWGIAFDDWGQNFFAETSGPDVRWMMPGSIKPRYGEGTHKGPNLIEDAHRVRPTSGLEFVSSRHFPEEVQGDLLINNTIGFLGMKMHKMMEDGTGYDSEHRVDLIRSDDRNFRPVDMEFAPDGSLYFVDWHNILVGHMQHNARDPLRDHVHGRIYRITYPSRPLVTPPQIADAPIETLLDNLKLPEFRARYRTRAELRGRDKGEVLEKMQQWISALDANDPRYEHHLLEALWVSWGLNQVDQDLMKTLFTSDDHRVRAAVARILRYTGHQVPDQVEMLKTAAADPHGRVRLEAIVAASWLDKEDGLAILEVADEHPKDIWMQRPFETALAHLNDMSVKNMVVNPDGSIVFQEAAQEEKASNSRLKGEDLTLFQMGKAIYSREGFCITCHQPDGKGLTASGFPPLAGTKWVNGSEERLVKIILNGLMGPIEVLGKEYPGQVPMTPYAGMLNDKEVAAVATYVRNSFGNESSPIKPEKVAEVREATKGKQGFYSPAELLQEHPMEAGE
ncbi:putative membrane-bound dehydrogenase domain-containing protein [Cyclobacterium xiamenense]|uniref:Putative membrane-bound dehydrogenase domain-containing protein n=1 Tax=Cyclobacterium xiamenense TaxID=1297121 RepID=A0A1H6UDX2_9BACT|nr:PVC-type heme-binding CxxCH protein [Cyclobacterium xiamenense]SEI89806.1 putative membrane-bound dehydrogenase domain-containing protein [Cyclobacterium xiamenense]